MVSFYTILLIFLPRNRLISQVVCRECDVMISLNERPLAVVACLYADISHCIADQHPRLLRIVSPSELKFLNVFLRMRL